MLLLYFISNPISFQTFKDNIIDKVKNLEKKIMKENLKVTLLTSH